MTRAGPAFLARLDRWIFESHHVSRESQALYRVLFGLFVLLVAMPTTTWIGSLPDAAFTPAAGPLQVLDGFPSTRVLQALTLALCFCVVSMILGFHTRAASVVSGLLLIVLVGLEFSFGKIDHNRHLLIAVPLILAASSWGDRLAIAPPRDAGRSRATSWPLTLLAFVIGLFFLWGGLAKVAGGWLDPTTFATSHFMAKRETGLHRAAERDAGVPLEGRRLRDGRLRGRLYPRRLLRHSSPTAVLRRRARLPPINVVLLDIDFGEAVDRLRRVRRLVQPTARLDRVGVPGALLTTRAARTPHLGHVAVDHLFHLPHPRRQSAPAQRVRGRPRPGSRTGSCRQRSGCCTCCERPARSRLARCALTPSGGRLARLSKTNGRGVVEAGLGQAA